MKRNENRTAETTAFRLGATRLVASFVACGLFVLAAAVPGHATAPAVPAAAQAAAAKPATSDADKTLTALHDELERSRTRLVLPGQEKPYYIQYRLLDLDERTVNAQFGALVGSSTTTSRSMSVDVRVGDYKLDSSNFLSDQGFRGFLGSTGTVGIDRDYDSLRQDLWLATDQAYKQALDSLSHKRATLRSLANAPTVDDFSNAAPVTIVEPRAEPNWTARDWDAEAKTVSAALRNYQEITNSSITYHIFYATTYLVNSEGTQIRVSRSFAAIEAGMGAMASDGMPVHNYVTFYALKPGDLPSAEVVRQQLDRAGKELVALRSAPPVPDYDGPILFEPQAAGSLLAQLLGPSVSGARPPLTVNSRFDQMMTSLGGHSEWTGRIGQKVLPNAVSLIDDPTVKDFQGTALIGSYDVDEEGVKAQRVALSEGGILEQLLMSRRPGPDFERTNGHGRSTFLADPRPMMSNFFFQDPNGISPADLRKKFLDACKENGQKFGLIVRSMDNPVIASSSQSELSDALGDLAGGVSSGTRLPLMVYKVNVDDGKEELVRGTLLSGLTAKSLRTILGVGNDPGVFSYEQGQGFQFAGTALGAFGSSEGGVPSTVVAPSLLLEEVEVHGPHGEPRRLPLVPPPSLQ
jgi:TldD protein